MSWSQIIIVTVVGYLLGSLPFAVWVARANGVDILKAGSGNPGATNVKRVVGKKAGNLVFALDALKGFVAAGWPLLVYAADNNSLAIPGLIAAVAGHSFSIFISFRGGKGVATTMGGLAVIALVPLLVGLVVWVVAFFASRYVSLASLLFGISLPIAAWLTGEPRPTLLFLVLLAALIIVRHRNNIQRLFNGSEHRFDKNSRNIF